MNSKLATLTIISPNKSSRTVDGKTYGIDTITIHCMAAPWTAKRCGEYFASKDVEASSNYGIGKDGDIALYVPETHRSLASSNRVNDARAITIEVACEYKHPYKVTDAALNSLINLLVDVCQRNGIKSLVWSDSKADRMAHRNGCNMTVHRDFANKACPGDYLMSKMPYIASEVNKLLNKQEDDMVRFKTLDEIPKAYRAETEELMALGFNGRGGSAGLDVTEDMLRCMIINLRTAKALIQAVRPQISEEEMVEFLKEHLFLDIRG